MFGRGKKEEQVQMPQQIQMPQMPVQVIQPMVQPIIQQAQPSKATKYFICEKKDIVEQQQVVTPSGQIIGGGGQVQRTIYDPQIPITIDNIVDVIADMDSSLEITQKFRWMLNQLIQ